MLGADSDSDDEDDGTESDEETPKKVCCGLSCFYSISSFLYEKLKYLYLVY